MRHTIQYEAFEQLDALANENVSVTCRIAGRLVHPPFYEDGDTPRVFIDLAETLPEGREVWHEVYTTKHRIQMIRDLRLSGGRIEIVGIVQARARAFPERKRNGHVIYLLRVVSKAS